jgi:uncharacterized lipoprotein YajG
MKKTILSISILFSLLAFTGCREKETKVIIQEKPVETTTEQKGLLEKVGEEVDKEVNEEIDKTIDKIGNDD